MKNFSLEVFSKEDMALIKGGEDVNVTKTILNPDGTSTTIKVTIKDDGSVIVDRISSKA